MKIEGLITASGSSRRMGGNSNKLFINIAGIPVLMRSIMAFDDSPIISSISVSAEKRLHSMIKSLCISFGIKKKIKIITGGETRQESVKNLLYSSNPDTDIVMVHDGARPMITKTEIYKIAKEIDGYDGVVPCKKMSDTVKRISEKGMILSTEPREHLVTVQTPQAFKRNFLIEAFKQAEKDGFIGTDESSIAERIGGRIKAYFTTIENIKITYPNDIITARKLIEI